MPNILPEQNAKTCPTTGYQRVSVCVPVKVTPFANPGMTTTFCCGEPIINPGIEYCEGVVGGNCSFTITQDLCIAVPVEFGAIPEVGDAAINCGEVTSRDICSYCHYENNANVTNLSDSSDCNQNINKD